MTTKKILAEVFPSKTSIVVFLGYMGLFVNQGLLVTASRMGGDIYPYNPALVVLATEFIKLIMVAFIYLKS